MKNILLILIACATLCACENGGPQSDNEVKGSSSQVDGDTIAPKDLAEFQQKYKELKNSIRDNRSRIDSVGQCLKGVSEKLDNKVDAQVVYILLGICGLLLILVALSLVRIHHLSNSKGKIKEDLTNLQSSVEKLENSSITSTNNRIVSRVTHNYQEDIDYLGRQIDALKSKVDKYLESQHDNAPKPKNDGKKVSTSSNDVKNGYFGVNDGNGRIGKEYSSATEEAVFKYYVKADGQVDFEPLSVKRIKSINSIRKAINILEGSLQTAESMTIVKRGQVVQRVLNGQKFWEIICPAEVKLK